MSLEVIKSYLVSVGFDVDKKTFDQTNKSFSALEKGIGKFTKAFEDNKPFQAFMNNFSKMIEGVQASLTVLMESVAGVSLAITAGLAVAFGIATKELHKFMSGVAQADMEIQKFARRMLTTVENARSLKAVMDAMGLKDIEELKDVAVNPELRKQFLELRKLSAGLSLGADQEQGLKNIRAFNFEFQKLSLVMNFFFQQLGGYLGRFLAGPMKDLQKFIGGVTDFFAHNSGRIAQDIAEVVGLFYKLASIIVKIMARSIPGVGHLGKALDNGIIKPLELLLDILTVILDQTDKLVSFDPLSSAMKGGNNGSPLKLLTHFVQKIYEILNQIWNWLMKLWRMPGKWMKDNLKNITQVVKWATNPAGTALEETVHAAQKAAPHVKKAVKKAVRAAQKAVRQTGLTGRGLGHWSWATDDKTTPAIQQWMRDVEPYLKHAYSISSGFAKTGHSPHSPHYKGLAVDVGARDKSIKEIADLVQSALAVPSTKNVNIELTKRYGELMKELNRRGVKDSRITSDRRYTRGEHIHVGVDGKPMTSSAIPPINININGAKDPMGIAQEVKRILNRELGINMRNTEGINV